MSGIFLKLLNLSISASWLVLTVLALRMVLRRAPKWVNVLLWAILKDAPVLLLDEATSALDVATERQVLRNLMTGRPNRTVIVTTHRPSVLGMCSRVYRIVDRQVKELDRTESEQLSMDF